MKYKIGDRVEYFSLKKIQIGTILELQDCNSPYIVNSTNPDSPCSTSALFESADIINSLNEGGKYEIDKTDFIIKKITDAQETDSYNTQKSTMNYYVGDIVKHQFKDGDGRILFDIGVIKKIILCTDDVFLNEDLYRIQSCTKDDVFRDVIKDYIIQKVHVEEIKEEKQAVGHPLKFKTVEELQEKIEEYKLWANDNLKPLTIERLACFLGCDRDTILNYGKLEGREKFFGTIEKIKNYILAEKMERLNSLEGSKTGIIFDLKNNYNMRDRTETEHSTPDGKPFQIERKNLSEKEIDARILELTQKFNPIPLIDSRKYPTRQQ